jgi:hypothetical protein
VPATRAGGLTAAVTVSAGGLPAAGSIEVAVAGTTAVATLRQGAATVGLPALPPGVHGVAVRFLGTATIAALEVSAGTITVRKAHPAVSAKATSKVKPNRKATVVVRVTDPDVTATGIVRIEVTKGKRTIAHKTVRLKVSNGAAKVKLPRIVRTGKYKLRVTYKGNAVLSSASAKVLTLRVAR